MTAKITAAAKIQDAADSIARNADHNWAMVIRFAGQTESAAEANDTRVMALSYGNMQDYFGQLKANAAAVTALIEWASVNDDARAALKAVSAHIETKRAEAADYVDMARVIATR